MADFYTRVELRDATDTDYASLDSAMAAAQFATTIKSRHGFEYRMPGATYYSCSDTMSAADVRNLAMGAARQIGKAYDIVTTSGDVAFFLHPSA